MMLGSKRMKQAPVLNEREKQRMLQHLQRTSYAARNRCMLQLSWLAGMRVKQQKAALRVRKAQQRLQQAQQQQLAAGKSA